MLLTTGPRVQQCSLLMVIPWCSRKCRMPRCALCSRKHLGSSTVVARRCHEGHILDILKTKKCGTALVGILVIKQWAHLVVKKQDVRCPRAPSFTGPADAHTLVVLQLKCCCLFFTWGALCECHERSLHM